MPLQHYLEGDAPDLKRYQLAQELAQLFDQYQMMRPDLLAAWQENKMLYDTTAERWQKPCGAILPRKSARSIVACCGKK